MNQEWYVATIVLGS